jgi:hypothetical protein
LFGIKTWLRSGFGLAHSSNHEVLLISGRGKLLWFYRITGLAWPHAAPVDSSSGVHGLRYLSERVSLRAKTNHSDFGLLGSADYPGDLHLFRMSE